MFIGISLYDNGLVIAQYLHVPPEKEILNAYLSTFYTPRPRSIQEKRILSTL